MSVATDNLARFLDVMAETLDEPGASSTEVAARLHLSRFHVDRLVSATLGEPPGGCAGASSWRERPTGW